MSYRTDKLVIDRHKNTHTETHTQAMKISDGQNWPRVINGLNERLTYINMIYDFLFPFFNNWHVQNLVRYDMLQWTS